jgi:hypothetical protein
MRTSQWILRLYCDPLSYGFHLRRVEDRARGGFVFGGFGLLREPALLLKSMYLRRSDAAVRAATLNGIDLALARPLGIRLIGVANLHGGAGELPSSTNSRPGTAFVCARFEDRNGRRERSIYDDISNSVNQEIDLTLHYKTLVC